MKRKNDSEKLERNTRSRSIPEMVNATDLYYPLQNEHLLAWAKEHRDYRPKFDFFTKTIIANGHAFERDIVSALRERFEVRTISSCITPSAVDATKSALAERVEIIHSAPLRSERFGLQGIPDLLVRVDVLKRMMNVSPEVNDEAGYVVIDVKCSTLHLSTKGLLTLGGSQKAYKGQLYIYNRLLEEATGCNIRYAYLLGRRWKSASGSGYKAFDRLGPIDFEKDSFVEKVKEAIDWVRTMRKSGASWTPDSNPELYPNMTGFDSKFKKNFYTYELTKIYKVGIKQRDLALAKGISSYCDPTLTADTFGFKGAVKECVDSILRAQRVRENRSLIVPRIVKAKYDWWKIGREAFVDFETIPDIFDNDVNFSTKTERIYLIGLARRTDLGMEYTALYAPSIDEAGETKLLNVFFDTLRSWGSPRIWHYTQAEPSMLKRAISRCEYEPTDELEFHDLYQVLIDGRFGITDCLTYKLKDVTRAMTRAGFIDVTWQDGMSGLDAGVHAYNHYTRGGTENILPRITEYNRSDCLALEAILSYLRVNWFRT